MENNIFKGNAKKLITNYLGTKDITYTFLNINNIKAERVYLKNPFTIKKFLLSNIRVGILPDINYFSSIPKVGEELYKTVSYFKYKGLKFCRYITPFNEEECYDVIVADSEEIEELVRIVTEDSNAQVEATLNYPIIHSKFDEVKKYTIDFLLDEHFRQFCETKFIKHKRGLIFEGLPGGGKSTCLKWLKKEAEKAGIKFRLFDSPQDFMESKNEFSNDEKKIFVFEDFDAFIQERKMSDNTQTPNTILSAILNTMDGINETNNTITIFTTNLVRSFDSAMIRPGRIDKIFSFELPSDEDIMEFYKAYLQEEYLINTAFAKTIERKASTNISFAVLKGICDDIHIHSYYSEGNLSEEIIVNIIKEKLESSAKGNASKKDSDYLL